MNLAFFLLIQIMSSSKEESAMQIITPNLFTQYSQISKNMFQSNNIDIATNFYKIQLENSNNLVENNGIEYSNNTQQTDSLLSFNSDRATTENYTSLNINDIEYFKKISGCKITYSTDKYSNIYNVRVENTGVLSTKQMMNLTWMMSQLETDRDVGKITGNLNKSYIENLFNRGKILGESIDSDFIEKALSVI